MVATVVFDPNQHPEKCERYLSRSLNIPLRFVQAERLAQSTRAAPWRLEVQVSGVTQYYLLRLDSQRSEHEYAVLRAMESIPIPTPRVYGWDPRGEALGVPCFLCDFVEGESLLQPMLAGEAWSEQLYIDTVYGLQELTREQLPSIRARLEQEQTAWGVLEAAHAYFADHPQPLAAAAYARLCAEMPEFPAPRFSNGDLWLDNFIVREKQLAGVIDFESAGFSDPIYEFLLSFFVSPELRDRGIEARYCERMGYDAGLLSWYRGLEYLDTWHWVSITGKPFEQYTSDNLQIALELWLENQ